jgi:ribulose-5-phosphate 4-epimerase/fuculose-1-phosphate aldolase
MKVKQTLTFPSADPDYFVMSRKVAPALFTPADAVVYRVEDASAVAEDAPPGFAERCIHSELYRRFPPEQVSSVVHFHSPDVVPFSLVPPSVLPFRAAYHMASFIGMASNCVRVFVLIFPCRHCLGSEPAANFDISEKFGPRTNMLITDTEIGAELAKLFNPTKSPLVLQRGHGATLVARDVQVAVFRAVFAQLNARIVHNLHSMLPRAEDKEHIRFLSEGECEVATASNETHIERTWKLWKESIGNPFGT